MSVIATFVPRFRARRRVAWVAAVALWLCLSSQATAAWRPSLIVLPASGRGVSARIIERARRLFVDSLGRANRFHVTDYDRAPTADRPGVEEAIVTARTAGVRMAVAFDLSHDGADTIFDVRCWDALSGETACHLREKTAAGPDLLPDFTEWLAMRLIRELDVAPESITEGGAAEAPVRRAPRTFTFGVRAGLTVPVDSPARSAAPLGGLGALVAVDTGSVLISLGAERQSANDDRRSWGAGLELAMPLSEGERMPYLGIGAWFVDQHLGGQGASGLQLRPTLGILWGRHDVARLRIEAGYFVDLFEERELDRLLPNSGQAHVSHGLTLAMGVTF